MYKKLDSSDFKQKTVDDHFKLLIYVDLQNIIISK